MESYHTFNTMVRDLSKPGEDILESLNPTRAHLLHMGYGLAGEALELHLAMVADDHDNIKEELGDIEFYLHGVTTTLMLSLATASEQMKPPQGWKLRRGDDANVLQGVERLVTEIKRYVIYNKKASLPDIRSACLELHAELSSFYAANGFTREQIMDHCEHKLLKGKNARYKEGTYSNEAATTRTDKEGE